MKPVSNAAKRVIHAETVELYRTWYADDHMKKGSCLYWSFTLGTVLLRRGFRFVMQAGDLNWPMAPDRGNNATHFGYVWSPETDDSKAAIAAGKLPEMHVWIYLVDTSDIVDFSIHWLPEQAAAAGHKWETKRPPIYVWAPAFELARQGIIYTMHDAAVRHVVAMRLAELKKEGLIT